MGRHTLEIVLIVVQGLFWERTGQELGRDRVSMFANLVGM